MSKEGERKAKNSCVYCGSNPVPHFVYWYFESADILLTFVRQFLFFNPVFKWLKVVGRKTNLGWILARAGMALKIIGVNSDINKCKVPRAKVLWEEAIERGIEMRELLLLGKPFDVYVAESEKRKAKSEKLVFSGLPRSAESDNPRLDLMDDKAIFKKWLKEKNLPVPEGNSCWNFFQAKKIFYNIRKPAIVKPRSGSRGRHSTTFVYTEKDLKKAFKIAKKLCHWVMVEEQLTGPVYRATLINFELCGVLRGDPPQVTGDGEHNIRELIDIKNRQKNSKVKEIIFSNELENFLAKQNLKLSSIPAQGEVVNLSEKIGVNYGGSSSEDFEICRPDNKELFIKAAKIVNDPIVGFDFIIPDIAKSWKEQRCGFIEANSLPFINLHHDPLYGRPRNVAAKVWQMMGM